MAGKLRAILGILFTATLMGNAACTGDTGPQGDKGDKGDPGQDGTDGSGGGGGSGPAESISAVLPASAFSSRTLSVTIVGNNTTWDDSITSKIDFGSDIEVKSAIVASPTSIVATIEVGAAAAIGARDVKVDADVYQGAFKINAPLAVSGSNKVQQGGIAIVHIDMLDPETPFDASADNITVDSSNAGVNVIALGASGRGYDFEVFGDVKATGDADLVVTSGAGNAAVESSLAKALSVAARTAKSIVAGTASDDSIPDTTTTLLYSAAPTSASLSFFQVLLTPDDLGNSIAYVLPASGKFADALGLIGTAGGNGIWGQVTTSTDPTYFATLDGGGFFNNPPPYAVHYNTSTVQGTAATETASHNTAVLADALPTLPAIVRSADMLTSTGDADDDWYKFTITTQTTIHVATGGDGQADSVVEIVDINGVDVLDTSTDEDFHEDLSVTVSAAGTYFVHVFPSDYFSGDPAHSKYDLLVEAH